MIVDWGTYQMNGVYQLKITDETGWLDELRQIDEHHHCWIITATHPVDAITAPEIFRELRAMQTQKMNVLPQLIVVVPNRAVIGALSLAFNLLGIRVYTAPNVLTASRAICRVARV